MEQPEPRATATAPADAPAPTDASTPDVAPSVDASAASADTPARSQVEADLASLTASLGQVGSSFSRFSSSLWGSVRNAPILEKATEELRRLEASAKMELEELNDYARKAQDELRKLGDQAKASVAAGQAVATGSSPTPTPSAASPDVAPDVSFFGESVSLPPASGTADRTSPLLGAPGTASAFFNRLQTQISSNASLSQIQAQLADRQKVAEGYLSKAGDYLNQAVRVVPPVASGSETPSQRAATVAAGRRDGLLAKLRSGSAAVLAVDPAQPPPEGAADAREAFALFLQSIEDKGGLESADWQRRVAAEQALPDPDVPSQMPAEAFWTRYFFRVHQIDEDEAKRRRVLQGADVAEDDFKWDDDEADEAKPEAAKAEPKDATSPRNSSDEGTAVTTSSYDMVSRNASGSESGARPKAAAPADDDDEDWE